MSGVNAKLTDGSMPVDTVSEAIDELYEDGCEHDSWHDIMYIRLGPYTVEYDHYTKELSVTGGILTDVDCIGDDFDLKSIEFCKTLVIRPTE